MDAVRLYSPIPTARAVLDFDLDKALAKAFRAASLDDYPSANVDVMSLSPPLEQMDYLPAVVGSHSHDSRVDEALASTFKEALGTDSRQTYVEAKSMSPPPQPKPERTYRLPTVSVATEEALIYQRAAYSNKGEYNLKSPERMRLLRKLQARALSSPKPHGALLPEPEVPTPKPSTPPDSLESWEDIRA
jgi:hypothetical protein